MVASNFPNRPFRLEGNSWLISQNIGANTSYVGGDLWIRKNSYSPSYSLDPNSSFTFWINGSQVAGWSFGYDFRNSNELRLCYVEATIGHNADGSKSYGFEGYASVAIMGYTSIAGAVGLPTIPRASTVTFAVGGNLFPGVARTLNTNRASGSFTHDIDYYFGSIGARALTGVGASGDWTPPMSMLNEMTSSATMGGRFRTYTYNGGSSIGWTESTFVFEAPASVVPTWTSSSVAHRTDGVNGTVSSIIGAGKYLQGQSRIRGVISGAAGVYGSTISSFAQVAGNETINAATADFTTPLPSAGTVPVKQTITDSRGRQKTLTTNLTVMPYSPPVLTNVQLQRCLANGTLDPAGTYLKVTATGAVQSVVNGTERNRLSLKLYWTPLPSGTQQSVAIVTDSTTLTYNTSSVVTGPFAAGSSYSVEVEISDKFGSSRTASTLTTGEVFQHWATGLGVGKYWENGMLDVLGDVYLRANSSQGMLGAIYPPSTSPGIVTDRLPHAGTPAQRDAYYGPLATSAQQVALANRQVLWFNTATGWEESYYAGDGASGLTVRGLAAGLNPGWYPTGSGPRGKLVAAGGQSHSNGSFFTNWNDFGTGGSYRNHSTAIDRPGASDLATLRTRMAGRYDVECRMTFQNGSGTGVWSFSYIDGAASPATYTMAQPIALMGSYGQIMNAQFPDVLLYDTGRCFVKTEAASWILGDTASWMRLTYLGPPLANAV